MTIRTEYSARIRLDLPDGIHIYLSPMTGDGYMAIITSEESESDLRGIAQQAVERIQQAFTEALE